ncbi:MAG: pyrroloquinoline quinone biosynthesis protein PqqB, partial [Gemmatimonadota bacterium]|nr:pyrroloquinoline quinone biosynthesis protein PqqB [Gemmatimonadota bacterium]
LGSAAGGGLPQWNCGCPNCRRARAGDPAVSARSQSSLAVRAQGGPWYLVNASPDVRQQLQALAPAAGLRHDPVAEVILTDAELDHTVGLLVLRESARPLRLRGTDVVRQALSEAFPALRILDAYCGVSWSPLVPGTPFRLSDIGGAVLEGEAFPVSAGDPPKYMRVGGSDPSAVGLEFRDPATGGNAVYAPAVGAMDEPLLRRMEASDLILLDGTFWTDDELPSLGIGSRTARDMGHLPLSGPGGTLERLGALRGPRKVLVHINNTNPILDDESPQRRAVEEAGFEVGYDGMTIEL